MRLEPPDGKTAAASYGMKEFSYRSGNASTCAAAALFLSVISVFAKFSAIVFIKKRRTDSIRGSGRFGQAFYSGMPFSLYIRAPGQF